MHKVFLRNRYVSEIRDHLALAKRHYFILSACIAELLLKATQGEALSLNYILSKISVG